MAKCDYCGATVLMGGTKVGDRRFCNARCQQAGQLIQISQQVPEDEVQKNVWAVHQGLCPVCRGSGPVDVHTAYQVWSVVLLTNWKSIPRLSCRSCGVKHQLSNLAICLIAGWWGFPWGLIVTPIQAVRNILALLKAPDGVHPSPQLEKIVRMRLGQQALAAR